MHTDIPFQFPLQEEVQDLPPMSGGAPLSVLQLPHLPHQRHHPRSPLLHDRRQRPGEVLRLGTDHRVS